MFSAISSHFTPFYRGFIPFSISLMFTGILPAPHNIWANRNISNYGAFLFTGFWDHEVVRNKFGLASYVVGCITYDYLNSSRVHEYSQLANTLLYGLALTITCAAGTYIHRNHVLNQAH